MAALGPIQMIEFLDKIINHHAKELATVGPAIQIAEALLDSSYVRRLRYAQEWHSISLQRAIKIKEIWLRVKQEYA